MEALDEAVLRNADFMVDKVYKGGRKGNASDDPLPHLIGVSNQGGFRYIGTKEHPKIIVLTSTMNDPDWPDSLDRETGIFTYYGDNKKPGHELHGTPRFGNLLLKNMFHNAHGTAAERALVPPVFVFANTGSWRDVEFLGLFVPGAERLESSSDLVAVWKEKAGKRFQNYQAKFTALDTQVIPKQWIDALKKGDASVACPASWKVWVEKGIYRPLKARRTVEHRSREEQLPADKAGLARITTIQKYFEDDPVRFEACAAKIAELMIGEIAAIDITRPTRDGGRDAIGKFRIGKGPSAVLVDFALEAKCYGFANSVGVKELSRLISRLRHRQFGILVTTSYVATQAYQEIKEDQHPIVIICARDILDVLRASGINTDDELRKWLSAF